MSKALAAGIAVAGVAAVGGAAIYFASKGAPAPTGPSATICFVVANGTCSTSPTYTPGETMQANITVPNTSSPTTVQGIINGNGGAVLPWSVAATGYTYGIDFGPAPSGMNGTYQVYARVTFADGSVSVTPTIPVVIQSSTTCLPNYFSCPDGGGCCPDGEQCADASGSCPAGTSPDPNNPGCCASPAPTIYPRSFNGPGSVTAIGEYCQPVSASLFSWNCCGTATSTKPTVSFAVQLIGSDGLPMTGAVVSPSAITVIGAPTVSFDKGSYITDSTGSIYPNITVDFLPTLCQAPSTSGAVKPGADPVVEFYADALPPSSGGPVLTVTVYVELMTTFNSGPAGICGSCP